MTEASGTRLGALLPAKFDQMAEAVAAEVAAKRGEGEPNLSAFALDMIGDKASAAILDSLDFDLFELLAMGWCKAAELHEYTKPEKHPKGEKSRVFLGTHKLATSVDPVLTVTMLGAEALRLKFTLEVAAEFKSAELSIRDGFITHVAAGECLVSLQLKYGDRMLRPKIESQPVKLPAAIKLPGPGYAIA